MPHGTLEIDVRDIWVLVASGFKIVIAALLLDLLVGELTWEKGTQNPWPAHICTSVAQAVLGSKVCSVA